MRVAPFLKIIHSDVDISTSVDNLWQVGCVDGQCSHSRVDTVQSFCMLICDGIGISEIDPEAIT